MTSGGLVHKSFGELNVQMKELSRNVSSLQTKVDLVSRRQSSLGPPSPAVAASSSAVSSDTRPHHDTAISTEHSDEIGNSRIAAKSGRVTALDVAESALGLTLPVDTSMTIGAVIDVLIKHKINWESQNNGRTDLNPNNWSIIKTAFKCLMAVATPEEKARLDSSIRDGGGNGLLVLLLDLQDRAIVRFRSEEVGLLGKPSQAPKFTLNSFAKRLSDLRNRDPTAPKRLAAKADIYSGEASNSVSITATSSLKEAPKKARKRKRQEAGAAIAQTVERATVFRQPQLSSSASASSSHLPSDSTSASAYTEVHVQGLANKPPLKAAMKGKSKTGDIAHYFPGLNSI